MKTQSIPFIQNELNLFLLQGDKVPGKPYLVFWNDSFHIMIKTKIHHIKYTMTT